MILFNRMNSLLCSAMLCSFVFVGGAEAQRKCGLSDAINSLGYELRWLLLELRGLDDDDRPYFYRRDEVGRTDIADKKARLEARAGELTQSRKQLADLKDFFSKNKWLSEEDKRAIMCRAGIKDELPKFVPKQVVGQYISEGRVKPPPGFSISTAFEKVGRRCQRALPLIGGIAAGWGLFGSGKAEAGPVSPPLNPEDLNQLCSPSDPDSSFLNPPEPATCEPIVCPQDQPEAKVSPKPEAVVSPKPGASPKPEDSKLL